MGQGRRGPDHLVERAAAQKVHVQHHPAPAPLTRLFCSAHADLPGLRPRNFAIVKHPGTGNANLPPHAEEPTTPAEQQQTEAVADTAKAGLFARKDASTAQDQLSKKGFIPIKWHGRCEADKVSMGTYDVTNGGMFGLVFDNTFSKQTSKTATFVLLVYPTGAPPQTAHHLPNLQAGPNANASRTSLGKHSSPRLGSESVDSLPTHALRARAASNARSDGGASASYHVGTLLKRRRKRGQGHARRFFSLDYTTCTLSYYHNRNSSALRGAIPLSLAAVAADERRREITIDSGAEVWHLKASNPKEFGDWARALERASKVARGLEAAAAEPRPGSQPTIPQIVTTMPNTPQEEDREWKQVETLVSRIVGTRDALRRLVKDMAVQKPPPSQPSYVSPSTPTVAEDSDSYFTPMPERRPFWKRKASGATPGTPQSMQAALAASLAAPPPGAGPAPTANGDSRSHNGHAQAEGSTMEHCTALLHDLDSVVIEFSSLLATSKRRRMPAPLSAASRKSYESTSTDEFFDAEAGDYDRSQNRLTIIEHQSEDESPASEPEEVSIHESSSLSSIEDEDDFSHPAEGAASLYPVKPKSLNPLPIKEPVKRRESVPKAQMLPPSLIAFVRKNVGKDLSTISMPVSANEPLSLCQRVAEQLEYAQLLDQAAQQKEAKDRLVYVTAFAISQFSNNRAKERAIRKPFNPLLGETFEMVRSDADVPGGFRLIVEKVTHRPVRMAMQADSASWSFAQSPAPSQKFWGKSAELTTEGRVRVSLRLPDGSDELYSWTLATMFLRNVVMGEKYVEPVGTMHVNNETSGDRAAVEFRARGVFGGRGEEVHVAFARPDGAPYPGLTLVGTWTGSLKVMPRGDEIWRAGSLVDNAPATYGFTTFAAGLNEITPLERGRLPPTDTRLRPDQRFAERGELDRAEEWKVKLEEAQRERRRAMEESGDEYKPRWFVKVGGDAQDGGTGGGGGGGEEVWRLKGGKEGYWEERARGGWAGVGDIFCGGGKED